MEGESRIGLKKIKRHFVLFWYFGGFYEIICNEIGFGGLNTV